MTRSLSFFGLLGIIGALGACASSGSPATPPDDPSEDALTNGAPFSDEASLKHATIEGKAVDIVEESKDIKPSLDAMTTAWPGDAFQAYAARLSVADAKSIATDPKHLMHFMDEVAGSSPGDSAQVTDITVTPVSRSDAFAAYVKDIFGTGPIDSHQPAFESAFRLVVKSLLSKPTSAVYLVDFCPDWCDSYLLAVTTSGEIRAVVGIGDQ
jgi:hypothetical protein